jgi:hypothetical protein
MLSIQKRIEGEIDGLAEKRKDIATRAPGLASIVRTAIEFKLLRLKLELADHDKNLLDHIGMAEQCSDPRRLAIDDQLRCRAPAALEASGISDDPIELGSAISSRKSFSASVPNGFRRILRFAGDASAASL